MGKRTVAKINLKTGEVISEKQTHCDCPLLEDPYEVLAELIYKEMVEAGLIKPEPEDVERDPQSA